MFYCILNEVLNANYQLPLFLEPGRVRIEAPKHPESFRTQNPNPTPSHRTMHAINQRDNLKRESIKFIISSSVREIDRSIDRADHKQPRSMDASAVASADEAKKTTAAAAATAAGEPQKPAAVAPLLAQGYVDSILAFERVQWPVFSDDDLKHLSPEQRREIDKMAALHKALDDDLAVFQAEVSRQVEDNGCYVVGESYLADQAKLEALIKEEWAKIDWSAFEFE